MAGIRIRRVATGLMRIGLQGGDETVGVERGNAGPEQATVHADALPDQPRPAGELDARARGRRGGR